MVSYMRRTTERGRILRVVRERGGPGGHYPLFEIELEDGETGAFTYMLLDAL